MYEPDLKPRIFWAEDEPDGIKSIVTRLRDEEGISVTEFRTPLQASTYISKIKDPRVAYSVGIADLHFENVRSGNGVRLAERLTGFYREEYGVAARIGTVTIYEDDFREELKEAPFVFKYSKGELSNGNGKFSRFVHDIRRNAAQFMIDVEAHEYIRANPPDVNLSRYAHIHTLLGYVTRIEGDFAWVQIWDPARVNSEATHRYQRSFLAERGIDEIGQPLRIYTFEQKRTKGILQLTESIGTEAHFWLPLCSSFDYSRFR